MWGSLTHAPISQVFLIRGGTFLVRALIHLSCSQVKSTFSPLPLLFLHQSPPEVEEEKKEGEEKGKEDEGEGEGEEEEGEVTDLDILLRREREKEKKRKEGPQVCVVYLFPNCTQIYQ